jgi:hypothetical protein
MCFDSRARAAFVENTPDEATKKIVSWLKVDAPLTLAAASQRREAVFVPALGKKLERMVVLAVPRVAFSKTPARGRKFRHSSHWSNSQGG